MTEELIVLANGQEMGRVQCGANIKLEFTYNNAWRETANAYPLSLSMPLAAAHHEHKAIDPFLWGLLPDSENVLQKWAKDYQISPRNVFALLSHVGEDCAGAIQFVSPQRLDEMRTRSDIKWLEEREIEMLLRKLREDRATGRQSQDAGQFSLAGAQPKTALIYHDGLWGIPSGSVPTTHILKPSTNVHDGFAENEYFCMLLAEKLGLRSAKAMVMQFGNEITFVSERYDRVYQDKQWIRIHQEDMCQALSVSPLSKYQNDGGPSIKDIIGLLRDNSSKPEIDIRNFLKAIILNWLIAGTDAHAKNYSMLLAAGGEIRLAPLYDIASVLPYDDLQFRKLKMAMKIGGEYKLHAIGLREWQKLVGEISYEEEAIIDMLRSVSVSLPDLASDTAQMAREAGIEHPIIGSLIEKIAQRAQACAKEFSSIQ